MRPIDMLISVWHIFTAIADIGLLSFILYKIYKMLKRTNAMQIIRAAVVVLGVYALAFLFRLNTILYLLQILAPGIIVGFAIVFQPEIRKICLRLGQNRWFKIGKRSRDTALDAILTAADILSKKKCGMLIVFPRHTNLSDIIQSGTKLDANITSELLVMIYSTETPYHDGAGIVMGKKLAAAGCFLPLSEQYDIKKTFGTRHRAALGLSEVSDAVVLVVSEETSAISLAYGGELHYDMSLDDIRKVLERLLWISGNSEIEVAQ